MPIKMLVGLDKSMVGKAGLGCEAVDVGQGKLFFMLTRAAGLRHVV